MKKCVWLMAVCILLLCLTTACGTQGESGQVEYYMTEYTMEMAAQEGVRQRICYTYDDQWRPSAVLSYMDGEEAGTLGYHYSDDNTIVTMTDSISNSTTQMHRAFDHNGNIIKSEQYDNEAKTSVTYTEYNEEDRPVTSVTTYFDHPYYIKSKYTYTYDESGNECVMENEVSLTDGTSYTMRTESEYDETGRLVKESHYNDDTPTNLYQYTYDDAANTRTRTAIEADAAPSGKLVYTYDDLGNLLTLDAIDADGSLIYRQSYRYVGTDGSEVSGIAE